MRNRRGITPIIAIILLLMMTIAIAGIAYTWLQGMQMSIQTSTENTSNTLLEEMNVMLYLDGITTECSAGATQNNTTIYVRNKGTANAKNINLYVNNVLANNGTIPLIANLTAGAMFTVNGSSAGISQLRNIAQKSNPLIKAVSDQSVTEAIFKISCT